MSVYFFSYSCRSEEYITPTRLQNLEYLSDNFQGCKFKGYGVVLTSEVRMSSILEFMMKLSFSG
jgi:hypothetical protein